MGLRLHFVTVDVFTDRQFGGNPLAVVVDAVGLSSQQMQSIAAEFNLAETSFVLPPKNPQHTAEVRIFTPRAELPFAGHPNIGTAFVLAQAEESYGRALAGERFVFEEKAGPVRIDILKDEARVVGARLAAPQNLTIGDDISSEVIAEACSISIEDIETEHHLPCVASNGTPFIFAELKTYSALAKAKPRTEIFAKLVPMERATGIHLYVQAQDAGGDIRSRMFAPLYGVLEDPATGSANVSLVSLLAHLNSDPDVTLKKKILQGVEMGRPSVLEAIAIKKSGLVTVSLIGGTCVPMTRGVLDLT